MMHTSWQKLWLGFLLLIVALGTLSPVLAQSGPVVKVSPTTSTIDPGEIVKVSVTVENVTALYGVELQISFDANLLEVVDADAAESGTQVEHGGFLKPDFGINQVNGGVIDYTLTQVAPNEAVNGSGVLINITFRGKAEGTSGIALNNVLLSDIDGGPIASTSQNGTITVGGGTTSTPLPDQTSQPTAIPPTPMPTALPGITPTPVPSTAWGSDCNAIQGYHVVQRGETLYSIGRAYATLPQAIARCNALVNPGIVHNSNRLAIPTAPWTPVPAGPVAQRQFTPGSAVPAPQPTPCRYTHTVRPQETLTRIGLHYGVNIWAIARENQIYNLHLIYSGQQLCIP